MLSSRNVQLLSEGLKPTLDDKDSTLIHLSVDAAEAFDYDHPENAKYSVEDLKEILADEILLI